MGSVNISDLTSADLCVGAIVLGCCLPPPYFWGLGAHRRLKLEMNGPHLLYWKSSLGAGVILVNEKIT